MLTRREWLALAGAGILMRGAHPAEATPSKACYSLASGGVHCVAGFVDTPEMPAQPCRSLTWATCLAYLLRGYGADLDLPSVLARFGQGGDCAPSSDHAARLSAASGGWRDDRGREFLVSVSELPQLSLKGTTSEAVEAAMTRLGRQPLLCGAAGHTTVITEITTIQGLIGGRRIKGITVRDPWAGAQSLRPLTTEELTTPFYVFALSVRVL